VTFTEYIMSKFQESKIADKIMELGKKESSKTSFSDVSNIILDVPEIMIYDHDLIAIISGFTPQDCYDLVKMIPVLGID
jgi:hypothetical protein